MRDWAHSRRLGTTADEAGYVVLRQPPASELANLFRIDAWNHALGLVREDVRAGSSRRRQSREFEKTSEQGVREDVRAGSSRRRQSREFEKTSEQGVREDVRAGSSRRRQSREFEKTS